MRESRGRGGRVPGTESIGSQAPTKQATWGRACVVKPKVLNKKSSLGLGVGTLPVVSSGVVVPGSGEAPRGSPGPPEAWMKYFVSEHQQEGCPVRRIQGQGVVITIGITVIGTAMALGIISLGITITVGLIIIGFHCYATMAPVTQVAYL
jgi:hypothetical protein